MKKEELCGKLRQPYDARRGYGIEKIKDERYQNIWFVVPPPPPKYIEEKLPFAAIKKALEALHSLPSYTDMTEQDKLANFFFVRREAVESSRMEGTWSTLDEVVTPGELVHPTSKKSENQSVRGYVTVLEANFKNASKLKEKIFTIELASKIHQSIVSKDPHFSGRAGVMRQEGATKSIVQIGSSFRKEESIYNPAPPKHVKRCLKEIMLWLSNREIAERGDAGVEGFSLPVRIAMGHSHFEAVHPFSDGNGRVGRALWPLQMICTGRMPLYLSGFVEENKAEYSLSLQEAQKKMAYSRLIEFICNAITQSLREANKTKGEMASLPHKWKKRAQFREKSASERALDLLLTHPILSSTTLVTELDISKQAAAIALTQLQERGIIRKRGVVGRFQCYAAEELISLLSRRFGRDPLEALQVGEELLKQKFV